MKLLKEQLRKQNKEVFGFLDLNIDNIVVDLNVLDDLAATGGEVNLDLRKALSDQFLQQLRYK